MAESKFVHNEQTKMVATLLNNLAVSFITVGAVAPLVAAHMGTDPKLNYIYLFPVFCGLGMGLEWLALQVLTKLQE